MGTFRHDGQVTNGLQTLQEALSATAVAWHDTLGMRAAGLIRSYPVPAGGFVGPEHP